MLGMGEMVSWKSVAYLLKPNTASMGYALFLAINAAGVWGGVFPFLPMDFQTPEIIFWFFLAQSLVFSLCYFASAVGVYYFPGPTRRFLVMFASVPYFLGWCCLIFAMYASRWALPLFIAGGALLGLGSAGFYMLWQRLFASAETDAGNLDLIRGTIYGAVLYFGLYAIPRAVTSFLIPIVFLPLFALAIVLKSREIRLDQPMFEDVPHENPYVYHAALKDYWRSAFCVGVIGFCAGIMRSLAIEQPQVGSLVNLLSMAASFVAAVLVLVFWKTRGLQFNVVIIYRIVFPFAMTSFLLLPLLPLEYARWQAAVLYAAYSVGITLMMIQCAQASRDRGINPVFIYGFFGGVVYTMHEVGFLAGALSWQLSVIGIAPVVIASLVSLYLLGVMLFVGQGGFRITPQPAENVELVMLGDASLPEGVSARRAASLKHVLSDDELPDDQVLFGKTPSMDKSAAEGDDKREDGHDRFVSQAKLLQGQDEEPLITDRLSKQAQALRLRYRLSARETEVMEYVARGYTVASIAQELIVSENTIRTHTKRIYAKLDIHKKRDLIEMLETVDLPAQK